MRLLTCQPANLLQVTDDLNQIVYILLSWLICAFLINPRCFDTVL